MTLHTRRSTLQTQILAALLHHPVDSVTVLAEDLEVSRPSVSRSLHRLAADGYVEREGRQWHLSETGKQEAKDAAANLRQSTKEVVDVAGRKFKAMTHIYDRMPIGRDLANAMSGLGLGRVDIASTTLGQMSALMDGTSLADRFGIGSLADSAAAIIGPFTLSEEAEKALTASASSKGILNELAENVASMTPLHDAVTTLGPDLTALNHLGRVASEHWRADLSAVAMPILSAQESYASFLSSIPSTDTSLGYASIAEQSGLLSSALADVMRLADSESMAKALSVGGVVSSELLGIPAHLSAISASLQGVFHNELGGVHRAKPAFDVAIRADRLLYATQPVSRYARATRYLATDLLDDGDDREDRYSGSQDLGKEELDPLLRRLDPDFVGKRHGAWMAYHSANPDRLAQAAGSQKNLLLQVLRLLVPDQPLTDDTQPGSKIKARVKQIMGGSESEAQHVKAVADAVFSGYTVYNKYDHTNQKHERALRAHMQAGEALLYMLLIRLDE